MPGTWYTSKAIFPDLVDDERKDKFDDDSGTDYPGALSLSALRLAVGSLFTPSRPEIIGPAAEEVAAAGEKKRRRRLSAEAASNRAELSARRKATKTPGGSAIRAQSPAAAAAPVVDPMPSAKSFNVPTLHGGSSGSSSSAESYDAVDKAVAAVTSAASAAAVASAEDDALEEMSLDQVAQNESWMVIYDKVYDLTEFFCEHPGSGPAILWEYLRPLLLTMSDPYFGEADPDMIEYIKFLEGWRQHKPVREYDHPFVVIGGGIGGITMACELQRRGRNNYTLFERDGRWGGATWNDVANRTTKLQTEKGSYHPLFIDMRTQPDEALLTWPSRDTLLMMMQRVAEEKGVVNHAQLETSVNEITRKGDPLDGGSYILKVQDNCGDVTDFEASAVVACTGVFYLPKDINFQGLKEFDGYISHGSYNEMILTKLEDATVCIVGHGGFTIENVRTAMENKAKNVKIVCRRRHLTGPKMVSWLVSSQEVVFPGQVFIKALQIMYSLINFDVWSHPGVQTDKNHSMAFITQDTSFGVNDIYFLAFAYGLVEVFVDEIAKLSHHRVHLKKGEEFECQVILKCLGHEADPDMDDVFGLKELKGYWINGEPLCALMTMSHGVAAKNYGSFSVGPFFAGAVTTICYFLDYPLELIPMLPNLPGHTATADRPAYYCKGAYMLACGVILGSNQELGFQLGAMDQLKARKTKKAHPMEKHLAQCVQEWDAYIQMMKDNGQIAADAKYIPYPYTTEILNELLGDAWDHWQKNPGLGQKKKAIN